MSSIAHGFLKYPTTKTVIILNDAEQKKRQRKRFQRLEDPLEYSSKL